MSKRVLSWKAVRRGKTFCSTACGCGCTWQEYQDANRAGEALKRKLKGRGWKVSVHENMCWHFSVYGVGGRINVTQSGDRYHVLANWNGGTHGDADIYTKKWFHDPNKAVDHAVAVMRCKARQTARAMADIERMLKASGR